MLRLFERFQKSMDPAAPSLEAGSFAAFIQEGAMYIQTPFASLVLCFNLQYEYVNAQLGSRSPLLLIMLPLLCLAGRGLATGKGCNVSLYKGIG